MIRKGNRNIKGIDISNWKGNIDYDKVKSDGIEIVYMKSSEGKTYVDKYLERNYTEAKKRGLKVGFYHFFRGDGINEARHFADCLKGKTSDCLLALDVESTNNMNKTNLTTECIKFIEELKKLTNTKVVVYTYTSFARNNLDNRLSKYPCWIAEYGVSEPHNNPIWNEWVGFQYSENGTVHGVSGGCDMNIFTENILIEGGKKKVKYIIVYNNIADQRSAEYLADKLNCPTVWGARSFDFSCVENIIGVGGTKDQYTQYLTTLVSGKSRYDTMQEVLNFIKTL